MAKRSGSARRFLLAAILFGIFLVFDVVLFGWLLVDTLSEREFSRVLGEEREGAESLAARLAPSLRQDPEDPYIAVARQTETQEFVESVLQRRELVRTVEIFDREGRLIFQRNREDVIPGEGGDLLVARPTEIPPHYERHETEETFEVMDLEVPIEDLGTIRFGISAEEVNRRALVLRSDLQRRVGLVGGVTVAVLLFGYVVFWRLLRRGQRLEEQAVAAEQMAYVGTLAAGLAHEIRNPLNSVSLNMQLMEEELRGREGARASGRLLEITRSEVGRLEGLVTDFLAYARPRALERVRVRPATLLERLGQLIDREARIAGVQVVVEDESGDVEVEVDPAQMSQLLLNLAKNAIAALEVVGGGGLWLRCRSTGGGLVLEVQDEGGGIGPEDLEKIYEVFYSTRRGGTGLGLAIAERIATAHGGRLEVESKVGEGSAFRVVLPVAPAVSRRSGVAVESTESAPGA